MPNKLTRPEAILIDLDDTILDTTLSSDRLWREGAEAFAQRLDHPPAAIDEAIRKARVWYWSDPQRNQIGRLDLFRARRDAVHNGLQRLGVNDPELAEEFANHYTERRVGAMQPFEGAIEAIETLKSRGFKLGMITNGKGTTQREKVTRFDLERHFDVVLIEGEFGKGKPHRDVFDHVLNELRIEPGKTWMVGDSLEWEVGAPQTLGMTGVWLDWKRQGLPANSTIEPDLVVQSLAELADHAVLQ